MAIAEFTSKAFTFKTTPEMEAYLESLPNKSKFIREAVAEKIERESQKEE